MKRAMFIKKSNLNKNALIYKLSDPVKFGEEEVITVVVSAVDSPIGGPRTTVFPADEEGEVVSFESIKECKGTMDHEAPLVDLGYEIL
jgi:hypothetical protein